MTAPIQIHRNTVRSLLAGPNGSTPDGILKDFNGWLDTQAREDKIDTVTLETMRTCAAVISIATKMSKMDKDTHYAAVASCVSQLMAFGASLAVFIDGGPLHEAA